MLEAPLDPQSRQLINDSFRVKQTTVAPSYTGEQGEQIIYYDGTDYFLYVYVDGAWRNTKLGSAVPTGGVTMYAGSSAPSGWLLCNGAAVSRTTYATLFTAISTTFGTGDGSTTFNVPDMRGRIPIGVGTGTGGGASGTGLPTGGSALTAVALAGWKGEETHTLVTTEIPAHTHTIPKSTNSVSAGSDGSVGASSGATTQNSGSTGSDAAHNNIQPTMGINYIIKT